MSDTALIHALKTDDDDPPMRHRPLVGVPKFMTLAVEKGSPEAMAACQQRRREALIAARHALDVYEPAFHYGRCNPEPDREHGGVEPLNADDFGGEIF